MELPGRVVPTEWQTALEGRDAPARPITLPDLGGRPTALRFQPQWILIHFWNTVCKGKADLAALNELSTPKPVDSLPIGITVFDQPEDVQAFLKDNHYTFSTLVIPDNDLRAFTQDYDTGLGDILIAPGGKVMFVGEGPESFRQAYLSYRSLASH